ncbi:hypothetical protein OJ997_14785 [Solirubrobacter phytolaccae]|uniref:Uncharacterized protein n=1 Tax=Solirubrobacter phytolaccae TaxID=1404360 RepID=A0A9X3N874_9ACTN|nr:hypothetical protein [Solirubrobacter phytolaccae]MDA0181568.1 hypothetical protein [Solirubrobacter phytolaccae]
MHPQLMTMYADAQSQALRSDADTRRRGRTARGRVGWSFSIRLPRRRSTRIAV